MTPTTLESIRRQLDGRKDDEIDRISVGGLREMVDEIERLRDELAAKEIELTAAAEAVIHWRNQVLSKAED